MSAEAVQIIVTVNWKFITVLDFANTCITDEAI
jgi:hypothetical protein